MRLARPSLRYRVAARWYDVLSLERPLYRTGRLRALRLADIRPGDRVLDVGCGTGLNLPVLAPVAGHVTGIDKSSSMLRGARARVRRHGWSHVELHHGDASRLGDLVTGPFDVVVFAYSLSIIARWHRAWRDALAMLADGGRVVVVDTAWPTGWARVLTPAAWLLLTAGGVHPGRRVWELVARDTCPVAQESLRCGHVRLAVGTVRTEVRR